MISGIRSRYQKTLTDEVVPYWLTYAPDTEFGGHFSCLDRDGSVFDTDKFLWMQSRFVWTASYLAAQKTEANSIDDATVSRLRSEARRGADFLLRHGRDAAGRWYFAVRRDGIPSIAPYNIFTDCFACMALAQYGALSGDDTRGQSASDASVETWESIGTRLSGDPKGPYQKRLPGSRQFRALNIPMISLNLASALAGTPAGKRIGEEVLRASATRAIRDVVALHIDESEGVLRERIPVDPADGDSTEGRLFTPGHAAETISFILAWLMHSRAPENDEIERTLSALLVQILERGWDTHSGGLFYYLDLAGKPGEKLEWAMKLWWVHVESALAALRGYAATGNPELFRWFERIDAYMFDHFPDPDFGEWFGYLDRDGSVSSTLKGGKWKGMFHLPRSLAEISRLLEGITAP